MTVWLTGARALRWLRRLAHDGYTCSSRIEHNLAAFALVLVIVRRSDSMERSVVLPKRWIVERLLRT
ncbi:hypothetical protein ACFW96_11365 [Streptomyces gardneri]|uniref:hypothetical protein n=1 Tax=Streptomyces gardneri TaxID=66892 RepID=UPI0036CA06E4